MTDDRKSTLSFKLDNDFKKEVLEILEASPMSNKDWFGKAVELMKVQSMKETAPDFASDLTEIEVHTTRIFKLVSSMVQKGTYLRNHAVEELEKQLYQQREITSHYQIKIKDANDERSQALEETDISRSENNQLMEQLEEMRESLETNKLLIKEYKEKNNMLTGLVTKCENYSSENEELKGLLVSERNSHKIEIDKLTHQNADYTIQIKNLKQQMEVQSDAKEIAIERLKEHLDVEHEKLLLQIERKHQRELTDANNIYNERIQSLYDNMDKQRQSFEKKANELQHKLDSKQKGSKRE